MEETQTTEQGSIRPAKKQKSFLSFFKKNKKIFTFVLLGVLFVGGSAYGGYYYRGKVEKNNPDQAAVSGAKTTDDLPDVVALVNGDEVKKDEFVKRAQLSATSYQSQGVDVSSAEAQTEILQNIINIMVQEKIVLQYAVKERIKVEDAQIEEQYRKIVEQLGGDEKAKESMASQGLDETYVRNDIARQLTIEAYLNKAIDFSGIQVTDQEIQDAYDKATVAEGQQKPVFEDVKEDVRTQLTNQKKQELINQHIKTLVDASNVQIMF